MHVIQLKVELICLIKLFLFIPKRKVYKWCKSIFYYLLVIKILNASVLLYQQYEIRKKIYILKCFISDKI